MLILLSFIAVLAILSYVYIKKTFSYWTNKNVHQASIWTCVNDIRKMLFSSQNFVDYWIEAHERTKNHRYFGGYQLGSPTLFLQDPELIKTMLVKDFDSFANHREFAHPDSDPLWYRSLISLKNDKWRAMRATLSPTFTGSKMRAMFTLMDEAAIKYVEFYRNGPPQFSLECKDSFTKLTNDIIASCAFGIQVNSLKDPNNDFYKTAKEATNFGGALKAIKFLLSMFSDTFKKIFKTPIFSENVQKFFGDLILSTIKIREEQHIIRPDMIHLLMEARKGLLKHEEHDYDENITSKQHFSMLEPTHYDRNHKLQLDEITDLDIIAQAMTFISGGFETVASTFSLLVYEVAVNLHVQERLRDEIKECVDDNDGKLTYNAVISMKYLDMVVSESLRKWPVALLLDRLCEKTYTIPRDPKHNEDELTLNPKDVVLINVMGIHRDPNLYPEPERFDPERFNDENKHNITPYNYMPFGVGPRHCIANRFALMEMKTILVRLLLNFEVYPVDKTHIPLKLEKSLTIMAKGGFWVGLKQL